MKKFYAHIPSIQKSSIHVHKSYSNQWMPHTGQMSNAQQAFMFYAVDANTGYGLQGAEFTLWKNGEIIFKSYSNSMGAVWFPPLKQGTYTLKEIKKPEKYLAENGTYQLLVDYSGNISINGVPVSQFKASYKLEQGNLASFTIIKYDIRSGARLEGAIFELFKDDAVIATGISDADGIVSFHDIEAGIYHLVEKYPPEGYMKTADSHIVVVAKDGTVTVDGHSAENATIGNRPILYDIFFIKQDEETGKPLQGAVFDLLDDTIVLYTAISNEKGEINFGSFAPGTYMLREQKPPVGYKVSSRLFTVVVARDGVVTIDGVPAQHATIGDEKNDDLLIVRRLDEEENPVCGVILQLICNDAVVASAYTNEKGEAIFMNQTAVEYTLVQLDAEGKRLDDSQYITIDENGVMMIDGKPTDVFEWK